MATQASAITFLSIPGQGFESGIGFVQNYFGLPLALIIVSGVFLPMYRRFGVYTAYEFLGRRFDWKTRLLGAGLFLLQRGFAAGVTIYAPAIILSTMLGWRLDLIIVFIGFLVIVYTVTGGSEAVSLTQKLQIAVIFVGMVTAFIVLLIELPAGLGFDGAAHIAGALGKLQAVDLSIDPSRRYGLGSSLGRSRFLRASRSHVRLCWRPTTRRLVFASRPMAPSWIPIRVPSRRTPTTSSSRSFWPVIRTG